jgi:Uma2 family endonuclease
MISTMTVTSLMSADELLRLPEDGVRYELVRGELRKMSPAGKRHSVIAMRIGHSLMTHLEANPLGEVTGADGGFWITRNPDTVRVPDVGFIRRERVVSTDGFFEGPPDVAVEVISPGDTYTDVEEKTQEWLRAGTRAVVVVNPRRNTIVVHRPSGTENLTDAIAVDDVIPGWRMPFSEIFD